MPAVLGVYQPRRPQASPLFRWCRTTSAACRQSTTNASPASSVPCVRWWERWPRSSSPAASARTVSRASAVTPVLTSTCSLSRASAATSVRCPLSPVEGEQVPRETPRTPPGARAGQAAGALPPRSPGRGGRNRSSRHLLRLTPPRPPRGTRRPRGYLASGPGRGARPRLQHHRRGSRLTRLVRPSPLSAHCIADPSRDFGAQLGRFGRG